MEKNKDMAQQMVDQIFSFGGLGLQEAETSKYLVALLRSHGFTVEEGVVGMLEGTGRQSRGDRHV